MAFRLGRISAGDDFLSSPLYWLFVSNAFDGNPVGVFFNVPYTAYPTTTWGMRVKAEPVDKFYTMWGVYNGDATLGRNSAHGVDFSIRDDAGILVNGMVGYRHNQGRNDAGLPGNYKLGGYFHTGRFEKFDRSIAHDPAGEVVHGNGGFYLLADQMLYREAGPTSVQGLTPFSALLFAPRSSINTFPFFFNAGLTYRGLIPGRDDDEALFGVVYGGFSSDRRRAQRAAGLARQDFEMVLEWSYIIQLGPWLKVQPDVQYVIKPGGTGDIPDALVLGTQIAVNF